MTSTWAPTRPGVFTVTLLGGFELRAENRTVRVAPSVERLTAYVATRTTVVTRSAAAAALWPDHSDVRASANLRSALWRLRGCHLGGPVVPTARGLELHPRASVDIHVLAASVDGIRDLVPLRHDVLPEWTDEWLLTTREWFRQIRLHALEALCARYCRYARFSAAMEAGMAAVESEPLRESAHRAVVRVHLAEGNPAEALRQYELYRRLLDTELGLPPSPQFRALVSHLLGRPARPAGRAHRSR